MVPVLRGHAWATSGGTLTCIPAGFYAHEGYDLGERRSSLERVGAEVFNYASRELKHHEASIIGLAVLPFRSVGASHGGGQG